MITTLVIKAVRACNLRCPYCYYINEETEHYGSVISLGTAKKLYAAFSSYLEPQRLGATFIWHGGEPLMLGKRRFQKLLDAQREFFSPDAVENCLQTNGVLIDAAWADFFEANQIRIGISLDGPAAVHDRLRPNTKGRGTYAAVRQAMDLLSRRNIPFGVIAVADAASDGATVQGHLEGLGIKSWDFLLPMTNHGLQRRAGSPIDMNGVGAFLSDAFRVWAAGSEPRPSVRLFDMMVLNALGVDRPFANAGASEDLLSRVTVVETNGDMCMDVEFGEIERHNLGQEYRLGLNVNDPAFTFESAESALVDRVRSRGLGTTPDECMQCPVRSLCRGSHPGSRFDDHDGSYNHRSAYCEAMYMLSTDILHHLYRHEYGPHLHDPLLRELQVA
jgi:uncharacterized protein